VRSGDAGDGLLHLARVEDFVVVEQVAESHAAGPYDSAPALTAVAARESEQ
jgi:hypothetical protein